MLDNLGDNCVYGAGIYLPDQDAGWETGSAYDDQLERHGTCDAVPCICPEGRDHDEDDTVWEIVLCSCCGAQVRGRVATITRCSSAGCSCQVWRPEACEAKMEVQSV